jgi:hypothetical protein
VRAAARCEIAGVAKLPTVVKALAPTAAFKNDLRSMAVPSQKYLLEILAPTAGFGANWKNRMPNGSLLQMLN